MLSEWSPIVLQLSILMIVGGILGVISWIGYMMATTKSSPSSIIQDDDRLTLLFYFYINYSLIESRTNWPNYFGT